MWTQEFSWRDDGAVGVAFNCGEFAIIKKEKFDEQSRRYFVF
jgi:hypothetical protein